VDPRDPNRVYCAVVVTPMAPTPTRRFRSVNEGDVEKVLYKDEDTGAIDLAFDLRMRRPFYAVLGHRDWGRGRAAPGKA